MGDPVALAERLVRELGLRARVRRLEERDVEEVARLIGGSGGGEALEAAREILYSQPFSMVVLSGGGVEIVLGPRSTELDARRGVAKALVLERAGPVEAGCGEPWGERLLCALASILTDVAADAVGARLFGAAYAAEAAGRMLDAAERAAEALASGADSPLLRLAAALPRAYLDPPSRLARAMERLARNPSPEALAELANALLALAGITGITAQARGGKVVLEAQPQPPREGRGGLDA